MPYRGNDSGRNYSARRKIEFKENVLFDGKLKIVLLVNFDDMSVEDAKYLGKGNVRDFSNL